MALLDSEAAYRKAFYRLAATTSSDPALVENSEASDEVADTCLSHGLRAAQQYMLGHGMTWRWKKRSSAITSWSGTEAADGGRYTSLPSDFLRLDADDTRSALVEANGRPWGKIIGAEDDHQTGNLYYLKNGQLWVTKGASVPNPVYIDYVFVHPEFESGVTLDFPTDAAGLAIAYAVQMAMAEGWFPVPANEERLLRNVLFWERTAMRVARRDRRPRKVNTPKAIGHWFVRR